MSRGLGVLVPGDTGLYGKLASQGDFVSRRAPGAFVQVWDEWLQQCQAHCGQALGPEWEHVYQSAPVWWFLLAAGTCGESAWAGLVQPSVDRVGRLFPLTIVAELPPDVGTLATLAASRDWYERVEREAHAAFEPTVSLEALDERLLSLPFPVAGLVREDAVEDTLPISVREVTALCVDGSPPVDFALLQATLREQRVDVGASQNVWFSMMPEKSRFTLLVTKGLPDPSRYCALMNGRWVEAGWEVMDLASSSSK